MKKVKFALTQFFYKLAFLSLRIRNSLFLFFNPKKRFFAEYFTDRYIRQQFFSNFDYKGCMVEVGCATPELLSMSQHFRENGWRCIGVEPNPKFVKLHRARHHEVYEYAASDSEADDVEFTVVESSTAYSESDISAHSFSSLQVKPEFQNFKDQQIDNYKKELIKVRVRRLDTILSEHCPELTKIDLLAIDVEGWELEVLRGFSPQKYQFPIVILENLFHSPSYTLYMESIGYQLHGNIKYNYVYIPADLPVKGSAPAKSPFPC